MFHGNHNQGTKKHVFLAPVMLSASNFNVHSVYGEGKLFIDRSMAERLLRMCVEGLGLGTSLIHHNSKPKPPHLSFKYFPEKLQLNPAMTALVVNDANGSNIVAARR